MQRMHRKAATLTAILILATETIGSPAPDADGATISSAPPEIEFRGEPGCVRQLHLTSGLSATFSIWSSLESLDATVEIAQGTWPISLQDLPLNSPFIMLEVSTHREAIASSIHLERTSPLCWIQLSAEQFERKTAIVSARDRNGNHIEVFKGPRGIFAGDLPASFKFVAIDEVSPGVVDLNPDESSLSSNQVTE